MRQFRHRSQRIDLLSLMENDGGEEPADAGVREFFFIDADRVRRLPSVRGRLCQGDLTPLNCSLCTPIRFRIRFLRAYLKERGIPIAETRRWASAIDRKTWAKWKRDPHLAGRAFMTYAGSPTRSEPPRS